MKPLFFLDPLGCCIQKGPRAVGIFITKQVQETLLGVHPHLSSVSTHLASKVSIFWPCHLLLLSLNLSQRCPFRILWEGIKRKKQVDLQRPVQGAYLKKGKSAVSRYFRRSFSLSVCSPDGSFTTPYQSAFSGWPPLSFISGPLSKDCGIVRGS